MSLLGNSRIFFAATCSFLLSGCAGLSLNSNDAKVKEASELIEKHQLDKATALLQEVQKQEPQNQKALYQLAVIDYGKRDFTAALEKLDSVIAAEPFPAAYSQRALVNFRLIHNQEALADINTAIRLDPDDGKGYHRRAIIRIGQRQYKEALSDLQESERLQPDQNRFFLRFNEGICYRGMRDYTRAIQSFNEAEKLAAKGQDDVYLHRALCHARTGDLRAANADVNRFLSRYPSDKQAIALSASLLSASGDHQAAGKKFAALIKAGPESDITEFIDIGADRSSFTDFAAVGLKLKPSLVVSCLTFLQRNRPLEPEEQLALAQALLSQKNDRDALVLLESALASDPSSVATRVELIRYYARHGMRGQAVAMQAEALRMAGTAAERQRISSALR